MEHSGTTAILLVKGWAKLGPTVFVFSEVAVDGAVAACRTGFWTCIDLAVFMTTGDWFLIDLRVDEALEELDIIEAVLGAGEALKVAESCIW